MTSGKYIPIGKLGKPHGISGAFRFTFHREPKSKKNLPKHFFIPSKGGIVPFFVKSLEMKGFDDGLIGFEDIKNPETAKLYTNKELYLTEADIEKWFKKSGGEFDYLPGYMVNDATLGNLGTVKEVIESPGQILISFDYEGEERMVPLVDDFVVEVNLPLKTLKLDLPDGILEL